MILVKFRPFKNYDFLFTFFIIDKKTGQISGPPAEKITGEVLWDSIRSSFCALGVDFWPLLVNYGHLRIYFFSSGSRYWVSQINFEPLEVDFWPVEGEFWVRDCRSAYPLKESSLNLVRPIVLNINFNFSH